LGSIQDPTPLEESNDDHHQDHEQQEMDQVSADGNDERPRSHSTSRITRIVSRV
jgi:hypothetical protein